MNNGITLLKEGENDLIDSLYHSIRIKNFEILKREILKIPKITTLERVNFYLFNTYAITLMQGIETFEEKWKKELLETCLIVKKYC